MLTVLARVLPVFLGLILFIAAAVVYSPIAPFGALFLVGIGALLLGLGVGQVSIPGAALSGSAGFVLLVIAAIGPGLHL
jgi:hypothetical protein